MLFDNNFMKKVRKEQKRIEKIIKNREKKMEKTYQEMKKKKPMW
jgi:hypothetical protein